MYLFEEEIEPRLKSGMLLITLLQWGVTQNG